MSLISINNLTFAYEGTYTNIFENAYFSMDSAQRIGFVARNGRGKTTLLKILSGKLDYTGNINASVEFEYFPFEFSNTDSTSIELIADIAQMDLDTEQWRIIRELNLLEVNTDAAYQPYSTLSGGERAKVQLAALFLRDNSFLLIDEPTNHLDMYGRLMLGKYLSGKEGFILVSHDRALLDACTTHTLSINRSGITLEAGSFSVWEQNKRNRDRLEEAQNERLEQEISRLDEAMKKGIRWADKVEDKKIGQGACDRGYIGAHSAKMMKRAKSTQARIQRMRDEKSALMQDIERAPALKLTSLDHYSNRLIEFQDVALSYGERDIFSNVSFDIKRSERVCLRGQNGCGKSSIIKLMLGLDIPYTGIIRGASNMVISYVGQETEGLHGSIYDFAEEYRIDLTQFFTILRKLDFPREQFEKDMADYSAGQRKKALVARSLCEKAHIYIWDEPLNYIDVLSRMQIEEMLKNYPSTMVFVEHDSTFQNNIATRFIDI